MKSQAAAYICRRCQTSFGNNKESYRKHLAGRCRSRLFERFERHTQENTIANSFPTSIDTERSTGWLQLRGSAFNTVTQREIDYVKNAMKTIIKKGMPFTRLKPDTCFEEPDEPQIEPDLVHEPEAPQLEEPILPQPEDEKPEEPQEEELPDEKRQTQRKKKIRKQNRKVQIVPYEHESSFYSQSEVNLPVQSQEFSQLQLPQFQLDLTEKVSFRKLWSTAFSLKETIDRVHLFSFSRIQCVPIFELLNSELLDCLVWYNEDYSKLPIQCRRHPNHGDVVNFLRSAPISIKQKHSLKMDLYNIFRKASENGQDYYYRVICQDIRQAIARADSVNLHKVYCYCRNCSENHYKMNTLLKDTPLPILEAARIPAVCVNGPGRQHFGKAMYAKYSSMYLRLHAYEVLSKVETEWSRMSMSNKQQWVAASLKPRKHVGIGDIDYHQAVMGSYEIWSQRCELSLKQCQTCLWQSNSGRALRYYALLLPRIKQLYQSRPMGVISNSMYSQRGQISSFFRLFSIMADLDAPLTIADAQEQLDQIKENWNMLARFHND